MAYSKNPLFPNSIWDGTTDSYPDRNIDKGSDPSLTSRKISEIVALEEALSPYLDLLDFLYNIGNSNSILGVDDAGVALEYKDLAEDEGIQINHSTNQIKIKVISNIIELTNNEVSSINICQPVYINTADGIKLAQADTSTKIDVIGLVKDSSIASSATGHIQIDGILIATTTEWDAVTGDSGGLVPNTLYYLNTSPAGKLTKTAPTIGGNFIVRIGIALSSTKLEILPSQSIKL